MSTFVAIFRGDWRNLKRLIEDLEQQAAKTNLVVTDDANGLAVARLGRAIGAVCDAAKPMEAVKLSAAFEASLNFGTLRQKFEDVDW